MAGAPLPRRVIGALDLGGTKIAAVVATPEGHILGRSRRPTEALEGPQAGLGRLIATLRVALEEGGLRPRDLAGVGLAAAGPVDREAGHLSAAPNLPGWAGVPLRDLLAEALGVPVWMENDASAGALGEHRFGAGRGLRHMLYMTLGTGIGGGIIVDGELYGGALGTAGEFGHMSLSADGPTCTCGSRGCLEVLASGTALAREGAAAVEQGRAPLLARMAAEGGPVTARLVHEAARRGDPGALAVVQQVAEYLGAGLANLVNIFNPEAILIGGGLAEMGSLLLDPAIEMARQRAFKLPMGAVRISVGSLGDEAGVMGAVALVAAATKQPTI